MAKVVRVYGKADSFDIELTRNGDIWEVDIPPDMTDGVYAVELTAVDVNGDWAFWAGELFMVDGVCCMKLEPVPYRAELKVKEYAAEFIQKHSALLKASEYYTQHLRKYDVQIIKTNKLPRYTARIVKKTDVIGIDSAFSVLLCAGSAQVKKKTDFNVLYTTGTEILFRKEHCYVHR